VRSAFEDKSLRIPCHPKIRADLRAIKKETTAAGNLRFTADRGRNGHSDRFWALALARHAAGKRQEGITGVEGIRIAGNAPSRFGRGFAWWVGNRHNR
jgi:phage FluMu gp28-like protein